MSDTTSWPSQDDGETYVARQDYGGPTTQTRRKRAGRGGFHVASAFFALVLTPVALVALDYGLASGWDAVPEAAAGERVPMDAGIAMGVAAAVLLVVVALSRLSGLGPLLAGIVWGVLPAVGFALVPAQMARRMSELADPYAGFLVGLIDSSAVFVVLGGLLVGAGLFGRWRGTLTTETVAVDPVTPGPTPAQGA